MIRPNPTDGAELRPALVDGRWLRPVEAADAEPRWGHPEGLQVGLHPRHGPRGLVRIYAPYLGHPPRRLINFFAVEPIPEGADKRGYSELEKGQDGLNGRPLWSRDEVVDEPAQPPERFPSRGSVTNVDGIERLSVNVDVEPFDNGAHVWLRLSLRADRPYEVGVAAFVHPDSVPLASCVVTATMGNFARLRELRLADRTVTAAELWPDYDGDHFAPARRFGLGELGRDDAGVVEVSAAPDEQAPEQATYDDTVAEHWKYFGARARQVWRAPDPDPELLAGVNARRVYWASTAPIPGGASVENFELLEPFVPGRERFFAVEPLDR